MRSPRGFAARWRRWPRWARWSLVAVLLGLLGAPPGWMLYRHRYGPAARAKQLRGLAALAASRGAMGQAVRFLEQATELEPGATELWETLGSARERAGDRAGARAAFERAAGVDADAIGPRLRLALLDFGERRTAACLEHLAWLNAPEREARARPYRLQIKALELELALRERDVRRARGIAEALAGSEPHSAWPLLALGRLALAEGDPAGARVFLGRALETQPANLQVRLALSRACEAAGDLTAAAEVIAPDPASSAAQGAASQGVSVELIVRRGELAALGGDPARCRAFAATLPPEAAAHAAYLDGLAASTQGDPAGAEAAYRGALARAPYLTAARLGLARLLASRGELRGARAELQAALDDDPLLLPARLLLAELLIQDGALDEGAAEAEGLLRLAPNVLEAARALVTARARQGRAAEAARFFEALERAAPDSRAAPLGRSLAWLAAFDPERSLGASEQLLADSPSARGALEVMAAAHAARRSLADAIDKLRLLIAARPDLAPLRVRLASLLVSVGRLDLAEAELQAALVADPNDAAARMALAETLERLDRPADAAREAERVLAARPTSLRPRFVLARLALARGEPAAALEVVASAPDRPRLGAEQRSAARLADLALLAAAELGQAERARAEDARAARLDPLRPRWRGAAAQLAIGDDEGARAVLEAIDREREAERAPRPWSRPGAPRPPPRPASTEERWLRALEHLRAGRAAECAAALAPLERLSVPLGALAVDALLLAGRRDDAVLRAATVGAAAAAAGTAAGGAASDGPLVRALREHAERAAPEAVAALAPRLHTAVMAASLGFRGPGARLAAEVLAAPEADGMPLVALLAARALHRAGRGVEARAALERALERHPRSVPLYEALGALLVDQGDAAGAVRALEAACDLEPGTGRLRAFLGLAHEQGGDAASARESYQAALGRDPASAVAANNLAWLLLREGEHVEAAHALARRALDAAPGSAAALDTLGFAELVRERVAEAVEALSRARALAPREPRIRYHLGLAYERRGELRRALAELDAAILLGGDGEDARQAASAREALLDRLRGGRRPGRSLADAGRLDPGAAVEDSLGPAEVPHVYKVEPLGATDLALLYRGPRDADTELRLVLREARGARTLKATPVPAAGALRWALALRPGLYGIEVVSPGRPSIALYRLALEPLAAAEPGEEREPNDVPADAARLSLDAPFEGQLGPFVDRDLLRLPHGPDAAPGLWDLAVEAPTTASVEARLLEPDDLSDLVWARFSLAAGERLRLPGLALGGRARALVLELAGAPGVAAPYRVELSPRAAGSSTDEAGAWLPEPDDLADAATPLALAGARARWRGALVPAGDQDAVRLPEAPSEVALAIAAPADRALGLELRGAGGVGAGRTDKRVSVPAGRRARLDRLAAPGAVLLIRADAGAGEADAGAGSSAPQAGDPSPYTLELAPAETVEDREPNDDRASAAPLALGAAPGDAVEARGALSDPLDRDWYAVTAAGAPLGRIRARLDRAGGAGSPAGAAVPEGAEPEARVRVLAFAGGRVEARGEVTGPLGGEVEVELEVRPGERVYVVVEPGRRGGDAPLGYRLRVAR